MRYAIIVDGMVHNVILWDGEATYEAPDGSEFIEAPDDATPGWTYINGEWQAPVEVETHAPVEDPEVVAAKEAAAASLIALGISQENARTIVGLPSE